MKDQYFCLFWVWLAILHPTPPPNAALGTPSYNFYFKQLNFYASDVSENSTCTTICNNCAFENDFQVYQTRIYPFRCIFFLLSEFALSPTTESSVKLPWNLSRPSSMGNAQEHGPGCLEVMACFHPGSSSFRTHLIHQIWQQKDEINYHYGYWEE